MRSINVIASIRSSASYPGFPTSPDMLPLQGNSHIRTIKRYARVCSEDSMNWQDPWTFAEPEKMPSARCYYVQWQRLSKNPKT